MTNWKLRIIVYKCKFDELSFGKEYVVFVIRKRMKNTLTTNYQYIIKENGLIV